MFCGFLSWANRMNSRAPNYAASAQLSRGVAHAARAARRTRAPWQRSLALEGSSSQRTESDPEMLILYAYILLIKKVNIWLIYG